MGSEELHSLYRSPNMFTLIKSIRLRWIGHVVRMKKGRSVLKILIGKPTGKKLLGRTRSGWEDNIRINLKDMGINMRCWD